MKDNKKDPKLGNEVAQMLIALNIENPIRDKLNHEKIKTAITELVDGLGISREDESMKKTPKRVADFFVKELFSGLNYANFPQISFTKNAYNYDGPVIAKNVAFNSTCEHHLVTISGHAFIAYIPSQNVVGLSKLNRIVDFFAKRPQVQERATMQIFHTLRHVLNTEDIAVLINATHHCVTLRGVHDHEAENITYKLGGKFQEESMRRDFMSMVKESQI